ncbi:hypothetical protein KQI68_07040 [Peptoniphilus sp. MSJ-1]|uniref:Uncharacterized protein n=1 Tax=Peptoniphilus ovalis TaxID=2841503 RepID=A0ABS6FHE6_9FIRM|nr:hypothetical protein [Peptoniphilus ovalis]MBU5669593.1 hypothetical protein [Peptoniphilus ovalis]
MSKLKNTIAIDVEFERKWDKIFNYFKTLNKISELTNISSMSLSNINRGITGKLQQKNYDSIINLYNTNKDEIEKNWKAKEERENKKPEIKKILIGKTYKLSLGRDLDGYGLVESGVAVEEYNHFYRLKSDNYYFTISKNDLHIEDLRLKEN